MKEKIIKLFEQKYIHELSGESYYSKNDLDKKEDGSYVHPGTQCGFSWYEAGYCEGYSECSKGMKDFISQRNNLTMAMKDSGLFKGEG